MSRIPVGHTVDKSKLRLELSASDFTGADGLRHMEYSLCLVGDGFRCELYCGDECNAEAIAKEIKRRPECAGETVRVLAYYKGVISPNGRREVVEAVFNDGSIVVRRGRDEFYFRWYEYLMGKPLEVISPVDFLSPHVKNEVLKSNHEEAIRYIDLMRYIDRHNRGIGR